MQTTYKPPCSGKRLAARARASPLFKIIIQERGTRCQLSAVEEEEEEASRGALSSCEFILNVERADVQRKRNEEKEMLASMAAPGDHLTACPQRENEKRKRRE